MHGAPPPPPGHTLRLVGCGNAHTVWRFEEEGTDRSDCVLRVRRAAGGAAAAADMAHVLGLAGYVHPPVAVASLYDDTARVLCAPRAGSSGGSPVRARLDSPPNAAPTLAGVCSAPHAAAVLGHVAFVERDHARLRWPTIACGGHTSLCVEIKPKCGLRPAGAPLANAVPCCRFCVRVRMKEPDDAPPAARSRYCPLDFFSSDRARMTHALRALLSVPHNNLRVHSSRGEQVFGGTRGADMTSLRREAARELGDADEGVMVDLLVRILLAEPLLPRLKDAQRDRLGSAAAMALYERAARDLGAAELDRQLSTWPVSNRPASASSTADARVAQLREWLLALTAADVSVMIALKRIDDDCPADARRERTQPLDSLAPGVVAMEADGALFAYRVAVVDAQPKPPSKVRAHYELDQRLVTIARGDAEPT